MQKNRDMEKIIEERYFKLLEQRNELLESLQKIHQMSDRGSFEAAMLEMKTIAKKAIEKALK